ncbi:hypothetical protein CLUG_03940 [Clavispora lusitaniae ATCC 42720]|uniref:Uncharacterized protein n=1 Tax=Clavispora lusitaniae (strain ATCC 42720) TaxID=306902 RepID=C4Y706_CLAL4|nr:uncharacterized protein CLUG_03940 [Clavispora lusitaniae ATCC 42720]EEQ39813.1 hypothetical protein CLUG_03940 [Clavispora lusitaniae ATCC 42720]
MDWISVDGLDYRLFVVVEHSVTRKRSWPHHMTIRQNDTSLCIDNKTCGFTCEAQFCIEVRDIREVHRYNALDNVCDGFTPSARIVGTRNVENWISAIRSIFRIAIRENSSLFCCTFSCSVGRFSLEIVHEKKKSTGEVAFYVGSDGLSSTSQESKNSWTAHRSNVWP